MNNFTKSVTILLLSNTLYSNQLSPSAISGEELYIEANCPKCHNQNSNFDAKKNKAKNISNLNMWVRNCDSFFEIGWFPEEQQDVITYINEVYYKFKTTK